MDGNDEKTREIEALLERNSALSAAILRIGASLDVGTVLQEVVDSARALTAARYGVIATVDDAGAVQDFVTSGFTPGGKPCHRRRSAYEKPSTGTERLTALFHHLNIDVLRGAFFALNRNASAGIDKETWADYEREREPRLHDLHARLHRGAYRALPSRRVMIPKPGGGERPLGIAAIKDKIVQMAVVMILTPIYEAEFLGFSYGFRPGRGAHDALDALAYGLKSRSIAWILDADIRAFFDRISHEWLVRFVEHRIADKRIIRLISKWLKAGVLEDGKRIATKEGTPQGAVASPILSERSDNIGETIEPCGVPRRLSRHSPSFMTPALSHLEISRMTRRSPILCSTNRRSQPRSIWSK